MNRLNTRLFAATTALAAGGLIALTACSSGQISQTADQESAVNGATATVKNIALRNVHLQAVQTGDYLQPGKAVELMMVAANTSPDTNDKLVGITSDIGAVTVTGDATLPAGGVLVVGTPDGQATALGTAEAADSVQATVALAKPISNGLTYNFTFTFQQAGQTTVAVPISAGAAPRRD